MTADIIIGLDVGTTAAKVSLFSIKGELIRTASREYPLLGPKPSWHVQRPDDISTGVLDALADAVSSVDASRIIGISISTAMHGLMGLDEQHRPVTDLLTWADSRAIKQAERLNERATGPRLYYTSGTPTHPMSPLVKLRWFSDNDPALVRRTRYWINLKDWILVNPTGEVVTELSNASGTGMLDMEERDWNPEALDIAGVSADQLPRVHDTTDILPLSAEAAERIGLPNGLPVVVGAGDGPLGNLGTGAMTPGRAGLSLGTSGALRMMVRRPTVVSGLFCYALTKEKWVVGGAVSNGGLVQRWLTQTFAEEGATDAEACEAAEQIPIGSDGLVMIPYLVSERASLWDSEVRGAFLHVRRPHTKAHFIRAGVEGVAYQLWTILRRLRMIAQVEQIRATGGVFRSKLWREVVAGVMNRPFIVTGNAEGSGLGAAILGVNALGIVDSLDEGYEMMRGDTTDNLIEVSQETLDKYETFRFSIPGLLQTYGRLGMTLH